MLNIESNYPTNVVSAEVVTTITSSSIDKTIQAGGDYVIQIAGSETIALTTDGTIEKGEASIIIRKPNGTTGGWSLTGSTFKAEQSQTATTLNYTTADKQIDLWFNETANVEVIYDKESNPVTGAVVANVADDAARLAYNLSSLKAGDTLIQDDTNAHWLYNGTVLHKEDDLQGLRGTPVANAAALSALIALDFEKRKLLDTSKEYVFNSTKTPSGTDIAPATGAGAWVLVDDVQVVTPPPYTAAATAIKAAITVYTVPIPTGSSLVNFTITLRDWRTTYDNGTRTVGTFTFTLAELINSKTSWTPSDQIINGEIYRRHVQPFNIDSTSYTYFLEVRVETNQIKYRIQSTHVGNLNQFGGFQNVVINWSDVTSVSGLTATNPNDSDLTKVLHNNGNGTGTWKSLPVIAPQMFSGSANLNVVLDTGIDNYRLRLSSGQMQILKVSSGEKIVGIESYSFANDVTGGTAGRTIQFVGSTSQFQQTWGDNSLSLQVDGTEHFRFTELGTGNSYVATVVAGSAYNNNQFTFTKL